METSKKTLRTHFRKVRAAISQEEMDLEAQLASQKLSEFLSTNKSVKSVAIYISIGTELSTDNLIKVLREANCEIYIPAWIESENCYRFAHFAPETVLETGPMGIPQPKSPHLINSENLDLIFVPGLAFNADGARLGYGGGWYDRLLQNTHKDTLIVGYCHHKQITETPIPLETHDIKAIPWQFAL